MRPSRRCTRRWTGASNLFDTAEKYGDGAAELVLGQALKGRRQEAVLATKVYSDHLHHDDVIAACEASLKRLQTDYIDILQIHWPNEEIPAEETFGAFDELKKAGKIRMASVCNHGIHCLEHVAPYGVARSIRCPILWCGGWRVSAQPHYGEEQHILLWAYSPLAQGLLTGKFRTLEDVPMNRRANRMYDSKWGAGRHTDGGFEREIFAFLDELRSLCQKTGYDMSTLAPEFPQGPPGGMGSILVGARNVRQLRQNLDAYETQSRPMCWSGWRNTLPGFGTRWGKTRIWGKCAQPIRQGRAHVLEICAQSGPVGGRIYGISAFPQNDVEKVCPFGGNTLWCCRECAEDNVPYS